MSSMLTQFTDMLPDLAIRSAIAMLIAVCIVAALRRSSAALRHLVWCLSLASLLMLPLLAGTVPAWNVTWLPEWENQSKQREPAELGLSQNATIFQQSSIDERSAIVLNADGPSEFHDPNPHPATAAPAGAGIGVHEPAQTLWPWLAVVWAAGGLLAFAPLALGLWQATALQHQSRPFDDQRWLTLLSDLCEKYAIRRTVRLRLSDSTTMPLTFGAVRPVLLIPAEAVSWSDERRQFVLLHELAHVRRWDWLTQIVAHIACAAYWFNPIVWLAAKRMCIERERACDDVVLASGGRAIDYARELVALAASISQSRLSALSLVAVPMARSGALEDRLRRILDRRRPRRTLTLIAVCLGSALAAGISFPLAMLRAASPATADEAVSGQSPAKESRADQQPEEEVVDFSQGIRITVLNSTADRSIPEFRVIAGVSAGDVAAEFEKRTGRTVINWQPHTCRIGMNGDYLWPLNRAYDEMAIRIEADGYQPQIFTGIRKANGAQHLVFQLAEDAGVTGRVLTPTGQPAAEATVALAIPHQEIIWENGTLRGSDDPLPEKPGDRWSRPRFVRTNDAGEFRLPIESEPAVILFVHESGVRELAYEEWKSSPEVTLQPWGRIDGQVLWQETPGAGEEVSLTTFRDNYGYPGMLAGNAKVRAGDDGKFSFDRVLPGRAQIARPIVPAPGKNTSGITSVVLNCMYQHVMVMAGEPTVVQIGGRGRTVTGRFVGLDSWDGATYHFHPDAPHFGREGDNVSWVAFYQLKASSIGPMLFRDKQPVNPDGTITIDRMLPGSYQIFLSAPQWNNYAASAVITIDPETPGQLPIPEVKLEDIAVRPRLEAANE